MKNLFLIISLLLLSNLYADELDWVNEQVEAIKPPRTGMQNRELSSLKNPFVFIKKDTKKKKDNSKNTKTTTLTKVIKKQLYLKLTMVINQSAQINGVWYKVGDHVGDYTISDITQKTVLLKKKSKKLLLTTNSRNKTLKFKK